MKDKLIIVVILLIVGGIAWGCWQLERKMNFSFFYKDQVKAMIAEHESKYHSITNK